MEPTPQQLHGMYTCCVDFAKQMLADAGDFYPFGATLSPEGQMARAGAHNGDDHPPPLQLYDILAGAFAEGGKSGKFSAVALAANVNIPAQYSPSSPDGIRVHLECAGNARFIYVPYTLEKTGFFKRKKKLVLGEPFAVAMVPTFFPAADTAPARSD